MDIDYHPKQLPAIVECLETDGYVRIQFSSNDLPDQMENFEKFFVEFLEQLGGRCLTHNENPKSFVWHVQPMEPIPNSILPRSQTYDEFTFHTDCSYELNPPEYIALFVIHPDELGGGNFEIIHLSDILQCLSEQNKEILRTKSVRIEIPVEFRKTEDLDHIYAPILFDDQRIRYRSDIIGEELNELKEVINQVKKYRLKLNQYTMILLNNHKYLHGRTKVFDSHRHLLRIRFNRPFPFDIFSIYPPEKFSSEYLTFSNTFYDYLDDQHRILNQILHRILEEYFRETDLGETIRQTFQFNEKIHRILTELNLHRPNSSLGLFRPDLLFQHGKDFQINGKISFQSKICEINTRFPLNGFLLSAVLCSSHRQNRISTRFSHLIESFKFNRIKPMFIIKHKENGFDIHLFHKYWIKKFDQSCLFIYPQQLIIQNNQLIDQKSGLMIEQCLLELHQDEILQLPNEILKYFVRNNQLNYFNDFRTIFLLHDKRVFSLLSNQSFLYALMNSPQPKFQQWIPMTYVIKTLPNYLRNSIMENKQHWIIKSNSDGKGENIFIGDDLTSEQWSNELFNPDHLEWIIQEYCPSIEYHSMNLSGMLFCINDLSFNLGIIRLSPNKIVNISHGGFYIRPYVHQHLIHSLPNETILTKDRLHEQLIQWKILDDRWNKNVYVSSSGGSGGKRLFFLTDIEQNQRQRKILVKMMIDEGILSSSDICLNLFSSKNLYRSSEIFTDFCTFANCTSLPMNTDAHDEDILQVIEYFHPNVLMGSPFRLMQLAKGKKMKMNFEKIFFACEALNEKREKYFREIFNCEKFIGFYGSAETGVFACQSPNYSSTKIYLYPKELVKIEIINSKIIVTNLIRTRNQLIRFDTGDRGRIIPNEEYSKYGLIEVFQSERLIYIDDDALSKGDIEQIMQQLDLMEWQVIIDYLPETNGQEVEVLFRYVPMDLTLQTVLEETMRNELTKISKMINFRFQSIEFNQLITDPISNKLLKIIDRRI